MCFYYLICVTIFLRCAFFKEPSNVYTCDIFISEHVISKINRQNIFL